MEESQYKLVRSEVNAMTFKEANDHVSYWADKTEDERLNAACFIINRIFRVTPETKVERKITERRKHA